MIQYKKGKPVAMGIAVGRFIDINKSGSVCGFSTPSGTVFRAGILHFSELTEKKSKNLKIYEKIAIDDKHSYYGGYLNEQELKL